MELIRDTRSALRIVVLAVVAGVTTVLVLQYEEPEKSDSRSGELDIAFFIKQAEVTGTAPDGRIIYRVKADYAQQNPDSDAITMETVALSYDPAADTPWDLFSDTGRIPSDGKLVILEGNVLALSKEPETSAISIRTSRLYVTPGEKTARTDRKVVIERDGQRVNGIGMEADLNSSNVKLLSNVNGKYLPAARP